jgi:hypothetical protein
MILSRKCKVFRYGYSLSRTLPRCRPLFRSALKSLPASCWVRQKTQCFCWRGTRVKYPWAPWACISVHCQTCFHGSALSSGDDTVLAKSESASATHGELACSIAMITAKQFERTSGKAYRGGSRCFCSLCFPQRDPVPSLRAYAE